jgi:hypothetical protein
MGQEEAHTYRFPCTECGEDIAVTMHVDYEKIGCWVEDTENSETMEESAECRVVNLHANFAIPEEYRHEDKAFPHLEGMKTMVENALSAGAIFPSGKPGHPDARPYRRPDFDAEWKGLKKAWSLYRRGKDKLAGRIVEEASAQFYGNDPLDDVADWVWRFAMFSTGVAFEPKFRDAIDAIRKPFQGGQLKDMLDYYATAAASRGEQYHHIIREYFSAWAEFSQVHFAVASGTSTNGLSVGSAGFPAVQMYYGNAFETFASSVNILTMVNNVLAGRPFDQLATITLAEYEASDKGKRFDAFAATPALAALCEERDNQLRNASHHRQMTYDQSTGQIAYLVGKGGAGGEKKITYAEYLTRCARLHHQIIVLLRVELILCQWAGLKYPV